MDVLIEEVPEGSLKVRYGFELSPEICPLGVGLGNITIQFWISLGAKASLEEVGSASALLGRNDPNASSTYNVQVALEGVAEVSLQALVLAGVEVMGTHKHTLPSVVAYLTAIERACLAP